MKVIGIVLVVLGVAAYFAAPEVMNYSEVGTLRGIGGGVAGLGALLAGIGFAKGAKK